MIVKTGHIDPGGPDFIYIPFDVPEGIAELHFRYDYTGKPATALDIIVFGPDGYDLGNEAGFRGSSGGGLSEFTISRTEATPGYLPGDIESGRWHLALGPYRLADGGTDWTVTVAMRSGAPGRVFTPQPAPSYINGVSGWYRGDLHVHSVHSGDATYRPEDVVGDARARGLDFIASTEHHTISSHGIWGRYARPDLLILNGQELTTRNGHFNALGVSAGHWTDYRYRPEDQVLPRMLREIHEDGGIAAVNHPFQTCKGCAWEFPYEGMDAIEVWNGPWTDDDEAALTVWDGMLRSGQVRTAVGGSDVHGPTGNVIGTAQTVVAAVGLSRDAIVAGIKAGRVYVAESSRVSLEMMATAGREEAGIGGCLSVEANSRIGISLQVRGAPGSHAMLYSQDGVVHAAPVRGDDETITWSTTVGAIRYLRAEIRGLDDSMVALSNPIWIAGESGQPE